MKQEVRHTVAHGHSEAATLLEHIVNTHMVDLIAVTENGGRGATVVVYYTVPQLDETHAEAWEPDRYHEDTPDA